MALRRTSRNLATPQAIVSRQQELDREVRDTSRVGGIQLAHLVNSESWKYAKEIARNIVEGYATIPPKTEEEKPKWESACIVRWTLETFIGTIEKSAREQKVFLPFKQGIDGALNDRPTSGQD